jgi:hypothetical protein
MLDYKLDPDLKDLKPRKHFHILSLKKSIRARVGRIIYKINFVLFCL